MSYANRKDANHAAIRDTLRQAGARVEDASRDPQRGYDLLVLFRGAVYFGEVKQPDKREDLTDREQFVQAETVRRGGNYLVWCNIEEALKSIGAIP